MAGFCEDGNEPTGFLKAVWKGNRPFQVFMKDKPGKYGILIRMLADCKERYVHSMEVYAGKQEGTTSEYKGPKETVIGLVAPIKNTGRNVTDYYYTSVDLAEDLYSDYNLTLVETVQNNRKHIPKELKSVKRRELYSSIFAFTDSSSRKPPVTLVSYIPKPKKVLVMLSSQHCDACF
ncbi:hypothetical protein ANN_14224 [Periplaneta americana]|uniref:PiggyBac transposable element-derived protein domain-containing protein n=1 Tax=Periplaneta americana TaxID=6978 RepID=A0ABQ8SXV7_PERAM|nr:hypothetical protein ANN_14224 [Periplaneta americana]